MSGARVFFDEADGLSSARVWVVAEIGVNHDGRLDQGLALVRAAAQAGADAVKLQLFNPDRLLSEQAQLAGYQEGKAKNLKALLDGLALDLDAVGRLGEAAREAGLRFIVTPFSPADARDLAQIAVDAVKIASPDAVNTPLLEAVADLGRPMLVSTGTCELHELEPVSELIKRHPAGGCLLQCVSCYPTPARDAALGGMLAMRERFGLPVGYSDHTRDPLTGALAVAAGAVVLEKHLTYDTSAEGPDHAASADPGMFSQYVRLVRRAQVMLGPTRKTVLAIEADVRKVSRQSVCVVRDLPAGHRLTAGDLTVKRPGTGVPAARLEDIIGQTLTRNVGANCLLTAADVQAGSPARLVG
jgi:N,N'-diacetyllegionaminate synthase